MNWRTSINIGLTVAGMAIIVGVESLIQRSDTSPRPLVAQPHQAGRLSGSLRTVTFEQFGRFSMQPRSSSGDNLVGAAT